MNDKRRETIRNLLLDKRRMVAHMISTIRRHTLTEMSAEETGEISRVRLHPADLGTMASEQASGLGMIDQEVSALEQIDSALDRLERGEYGVCEECEEDIPMARLTAQPFARFCIECQEESEHGRGRRPDARRSTPNRGPMAA